MILTEKHIKHCPVCNSTDFIEDYTREEIYCKECGLVLSSAVTSIGLEKVENLIPHSDTFMVESEPNKLDSYCHSILDNRLMAKGHR